MTIYNLTYDSNTNKAGGLITDNKYLVFDTSDILQVRLFNTEQDSINDWQSAIDIVMDDHITQSGNTYTLGTSNLGLLTGIVITNDNGVYSATTAGSTPAPAPAPASTDPNLTSHVYDIDPDGNKVYLAKAFSVTDDGKVKVTTSDGAIALSLDSTFLSTLLTDDDVANFLTESDVSTLISNALVNYSTSTEVQTLVADFLKANDLTSLIVDVKTSGNIEGNSLKTGSFVEFPDGSKIGHDL